MQKLVECIPNFSEGRDESVVKQLVDTVESVENVKVLNSEMDSDHNRTVITFAVYSVIYDVFVSTMNSTNLPYANLVVLLGGIVGFAFMIGVVWNVVRSK